MRVELPRSMMVASERDVGNIVVINLRLFGMNAIDCCCLQEIRARIAHDIVAHQGVGIALGFRSGIAGDKVGASADDYSGRRTVKEVVPLNGGPVATIV